MDFEVLPGLFDTGSGIQFPDVTGKDCGIGDDDETHFNELLWCIGCTGGFYHGGVVIYLVEGCFDGFGMVVCGFSNVAFIFGKGLGRDITVGIERGLENSKNIAIEYAGIVIDNFSKVFIFDSCVDFLDDG